jgi:hypothetical protein
MNTAAAVLAPIVAADAAQLILEYVDKKTRTMQQNNRAAKWVMWILRGLLWLLEKIVAFINRNAFILVAGTAVACAAHGFASHEIRRST